MATIPSIPGLPQIQHAAPEAPGLPSGPALHMQSGAETPTSRNPSLSSNSGRRIHYLLQRKLLSNANGKTAESSVTKKTSSSILAGYDADSSSQFSVDGEPAARRRSSSDASSALSSIAHQDEELSDEGGFPAFGFPAGSGANASPRAAPRHWSSNDSDTGSHGAAAGGAHSPGSPPHAAETPTASADKNIFAALESAIEHLARNVEAMFKQMETLNRNSDDFLRKVHDNAGAMLRDHQSMARPFISDLKWGIGTSMLATAGIAATGLALSFAFSFALPFALPFIAPLALVAGAGLAAAFWSHRKASHQPVQQQYPQPQQYPQQYPQPPQSPPPYSESRDTPLRFDDSKKQPDLN